MRTGLLFIVLTILLVPVELLCVKSSWETQGEVAQGLSAAVAGLNILCAAACRWFPRAALSALLLIFTLIVPYQVLLLNRLTRLHKEIAAFVHERHARHVPGTPFPASMDDYQLRDPRLRPYISGYQLSEDQTEFRIYYFVANPGTTHWYDSKSGWEYYPD